jgi:hypothetical protein
MACDKFIREVRRRVGGIFIHRSGRRETSHATVQGRATFLQNSSNFGASLGYIAMPRPRRNM